MADSYFQTPTTPRLYVSYPLWQYATGGLTNVASTHSSTKEQHIDLIKLEPQRAKTFTTEDMTLNVSVQDARLVYHVVPEGLGDIAMPDNLWNFNYCMILNHNLADATAKVQPWSVNFDEVAGGSGNYHAIPFENIVNSQPHSRCEYNGFSLFKLNEFCDSPLHSSFYLQILQENEVDNFPEDVHIGSLMFGKYFDFPQNCNVNVNFSTQYGIKQKQTLSGKTISTAEWSKVDSWYNPVNGGTEPFGLRLPDMNWHDTALSHRRRSGVRQWKISFDQLIPKHVMNQNPMMNSYGWNMDQDFPDNHEVGADGETSLYNIDDAPDFYTNVVHKTMGGHLPMVLQIDKDDPSSQNFAIVRMDKNFSVSQKANNLYSFKITLTEQI